MHSLRFVIASAIGLASAARPAVASPQDALEYVSEAIVAADDRGGRCKRDVFDKLLEIRDLLEGDNGVRAAFKIQRARRNIDRCPASVARSLGNAYDELKRDLDRVRERNETYRTERRELEQPPRAKDVPWTDFGDTCIAQWLIFEISRGRMNEAQHAEFASMTSVACSNPSALATTSYYQNGQIAIAGTGTWYFPNGQIAKSAENTYYYPNGQTAVTNEGTWYFPNGQTAYSPGSGWYYPNGQTAGTVDAVVNRARGRATAQQTAQFDHARQSDVDAYRIYATVRFAAQAR